MFEKLALKNSARCAGGWQQLGRGPAFNCLPGACWRSRAGPGIWGEPSEDERSLELAVLSLPPSPAPRTAHTSPRTSLCKSTHHRLAPGIRRRFAGLAAGILQCRAGEQGPEG